jgi:chorismate mutase
MPVRGVRGATTVERDDPAEVFSAVRELLEALLAANPSLQPDDVASAIFTATVDLTSAYPARAAREMGWEWVPLMCAQEIPVPGSPERCIRVLIHWNTDLPQDAVNHIYLRKSAALRPDLVSRPARKREEMQQH